MQKADSLRAAITAVLPHLATDPDKLKLWATEGRIRAPQTPNHGFSYEYTLTAVLSDFSGHSSIIALAINEWLRTNQPDLLAGGAPGYKFEADIIDATTVDLFFFLELTEAVRVTPRDEGGWNLEHLAEPVIFPDDEPIAEPPSLLRQIYWKDELLVE